MDWRLTHSVTLALDVPKMGTIRGISVFVGVGERTREGNDLYMEMNEFGVINEENIIESKAVLVYGQMNETPRARYEVFGLLGRIVAYQPILSIEIVFLQERITSTKEGSITVIQAVYVPANDLTDLAPATTFAHLDPTTVLSRGLAAKEVEEIMLSTNSGQIGILPNHAPISIAVDIGILQISLNNQWLTMALMGGFARIGNNVITILVNNTEKGSDIDPQEAQQTLEIAEATMEKAEGRRQKIKANLALR
ncbi:hypothetical protein CQW23_07171 [Capsicum baccatum]|uniref:H(+)-transporting two-sector ATPase n=1 Tax=Capsicum baccatum TaxID=33114 RepID=A0A2G2X5L4_CAPBA|nr:hypothetical protein CQW23_07171 [Capsicum baccatum]